MDPTSPRMCLSNSVCSPCSCFFPNAMDIMISWFAVCHWVGGRLLSSVSVMCKTRGKVDMDNVKQDSSSGKARGSGFDEWNYVTVFIFSILHSSKQSSSQARCFIHCSWSTLSQLHFFVINCKICLIGDTREEVSSSSLTFCLGIDFWQKICFFQQVLLKYLPWFIWVCWQFLNFKFIFFTTALPQHFSSFFFNCVGCCLSSTEQF